MAVPGPRPRLIEIFSEALEVTAADELGAVRRAESLLGGGRAVADQIRDVQRRRAFLELAAWLDAIRLEMTTMYNEDCDEARGDRLYAEAFPAHGLDPEASSPAEIARGLPTGPVRQVLVAGLDDWGRLRRKQRGLADESWKRLLAAARAADSDPWRDRLRAALLALDFKALKQLQAEAPLDDLGPSGSLLIRWVIMNS